MGLTLNNNFLNGLIVKSERLCAYPNCEVCEDYSKLNSECLVPMIISKQKYLMWEAEMIKLNDKITELENALYDEILGAETERKELSVVPDYPCGLPVGYE